MREVNCPNCNKKLGEINEEERYAIFEEGVKPSQARVSIGMVIVPYTCPVCGKTHMQTVIK